MERLKPNEIERRSFEIIGREMGTQAFAPGVESIVKRVIHTTADFDYARSLCISPEAVSAGLEALEGGAHIVTDTQMAKAGINKRTVEALGGQVHCFMSDPDVAAEAEAREVTRATVSMERAAGVKAPLIFALGNAPTALVRLHELIQLGDVRPALVIGVPVGFVNVVESKELFLGGEIPHIISRGRKGGSNVAAAIINALLYQIVKREGF